MNDIEKAICSLLQNLLADSYGDSVDSKGDTVSVTSGDWISVVSASRPSILQLVNPGAVDVYLSLTGRDNVGGIFPAGAFAVWDRFEGTLYARATGSGALLNYLLVARRIER